MSINNNHISPIREGILHLLFWLVIIHFIFDLGGVLHAFIDLFNRENTLFFDEALLLLPLTITLFYWIFAFLIPAFLHKGAWIKYCISLLASYVFIYLLSGWLYDFVAGISTLIFPVSRQEFIDHSIESNLLIIIASTALGVGKMAIKNLSLKRQAEHKQQEAELKYLANQFNPHFLYNTLNGIYALTIEEDAPKSTEAILKLSEMMRYPINQGLQQEVPIKDEIAFIENFIALQKLRLGDDYPIQFEQRIDMMTNEVAITPLSLIVMVENAFKYGISQKQLSPISFKLEVNNEQIVFKAINKINKAQQKESHKIGLQNLRERLILRYKDQFDLSVNDEKDVYYATLIIKL